MAAPVNNDPGMPVSNFGAHAFNEITLIPGVVEQWEKKAEAQTTLPSARVLDGSVHNPDGEFGRENSRVIQALNNLGSYWVGC